MASTLSNGVPETGSGLIVSFGEMLIDFVPTVSGVSLAQAPGFVKAPGGAPANVAIAVSRLGGKASFVGKLGDDEFGRMLAGILEQYGVDGSGINFDQGARTALAFVTLRDDGEREFMFYRNPSADMLLRPDELNVELIRSVRSLSLSVKITIIFPLSPRFFRENLFPISHNDFHSGRAKCHARSPRSCDLQRPHSHAGTVNDGSFA
jgi:hypothetical protein